MTIEELEEQLNECQKALAELKESKKEGKWKPKVGETFWFMNDGGETNWGVRQKGDLYDEWRLNNILLFKTKEECDKYRHFMDTVKEKSYEFSEEEWEDNTIEKYFICHDFDKFDEGDEDFITLVDVDYKHYGSIYFKTEEDAQYIIDNFKEELLKYWL